MCSKVALEHVFVGNSSLDKLGSFMFWSFLAENFIQKISKERLTNQSSDGRSCNKPGALHKLRPTSC